MEEMSLEDKQEMDQKIEKLLEKNYYAQISK